ncbi:MFS transporter [Nocardioides sp. cx-169]|uniref:MFS transporter n=1 Tax=Nocardioides sp. cx-169 TaxID=2899080 RepID=UPI001E5957DA|nr:MFS transporter [Nocardioides sp. cx-169]MCD4534579.1 MFS transporter [Nocardioides sp. cx-169]
MLKRTLLPDDPVARALSLATMAASLSTGLFYSVSALYFTTVIGLSATTVGAGLTIAGAAGVAGSYGGGRLSDRFGPDRVQQVATVVQALAILAYAAADSALSFVLVACVAVASRAVQGTAKQTLLARWFTGPDRVQVRARLRVVTNVFIGLGTALAAVALLVGTATAYRTTLVVVGAGTLLAAVPLGGLRGRVDGLAAALRPVRGRHAAPDLPRGRSPLRDRTYLATTALTSVMAMQFGLQNVGVPLWVAHHTEAPDVMVSVLLLLNTVLVALLQVRASRGTHEVATAGRAVRRAGLLLALACLLLAASGTVGVVAAVVLLLVAEVTSTMAEILSEAGAWGLAFELADPLSAGAYQGVSQMGYSVAGMVAPLVITVTAIERGTPGWLFLGSVFLTAGVLVALVAARASRATFVAPPEGATAGASALR